MSYGDLPLDAPEKPNKGKEGGACNRRSCQAEPALFYNHGSYAWYCGDCARDIGQDHVNKRDWDLRWKPECGHDQFETREQMDARKAANPVVEEKRYKPITPPSTTDIHLRAVSNSGRQFVPACSRWSQGTMTPDPAKVTCAKCKEKA